MHGVWEVADAEMLVGDGTWAGVSGQGGSEMYAERTAS